MKLHIKSGVGSSPATLYFVGWVEPSPGFVGFRCTQPNLHFAGVVVKRETQRRPIWEPSPKSFYFDQNGHYATGSWADTKMLCNFQTMGFSLNFRGFALGRIRLNCANFQ